MNSYRKGDLVTVTGQVQNVEGGFLMIALTGAIDASVPAMVSEAGVELVRASVHENDIVEGGMRVHSFIPNTPLALLQLVDGDPADPKSFSTAVRDSLKLISAAGKTPSALTPAVAAKPAPAPIPASTPAPAPAATVAPIPAPTPTEPLVDEPAPAISPAPAIAPATDAPASEVSQSGPANDGASETKPVAMLGADTARRPEAVATDRFSGIASDALRATQGGSIASLGTVREEASPLKPAADELLLSDEIHDDKN